MSALSSIRSARGFSLLRLGGLQFHHVNSSSLMRLYPVSRSLHSLSSTGKVRNSLTSCQLPFSIRSSLPKPTVRTYADRNGSTGKAEADLLVEELQELYEVAKDEFEIATESTDSSTIYAASDRESARDALNQLSAVYSLYTARPGEVENETDESLSEVEEPEESAIVETQYNPAEISQGVKDEVRRRVGHRIRELKNAIEALEERAMED
ncbi:Major facilitator superfamily domain, general substrate transporter [Penicillium digitatum]|uniref:3-oxoacyl-(Acyl-carrier-protein) reductase n=3 Tax=Penicillium digitatum TaxID=36651 RepID=K9GHN3_PEND2|nr:hypothetical protein PDIP_06390 [Penicillium digitatum Pd1]EKV12731.1 hypothetical protein PDIG_41670 [Penicillium digitatum PHI26]EKV21430.1 hypothetical protein PDIP_06390 [Penicillium digitatum Pd1]KAG0155410.1 hypothetical protein PDIDSM_987 [Penicillium digitatum]QQK46672.1 Major facilitator superfamily domain, general substrate transporter [Penicillium digitatum]